MCIFLGILCSHWNMMLTEMHMSVQLIRKTNYHAVVPSWCLMAGLNDFPDSNKGITQHFDHAMCI